MTILLMLRREELELYITTHQSSSAFCKKFITLKMHKIIYWISFGWYSIHDKSKMTKILNLLHFIYLHTYISFCYIIVSLFKHCKTNFDRYIKQYVLQRMENRLNLGEKIVFADNFRKSIHIICLGQAH
jgi:hypothetical protein